MPDENIAELLSTFLDKWNNNTIAELEKLNISLTAIEKRLGKFEIDFAVLKTEFKFKSGIWGLVGSAVPVIIGLGIWVLRSSGG